MEEVGVSLRQRMTQRVIEDDEDDEDTDDEDDEEDDEVIDDEEPERLWFEQ